MHYPNRNVQFVNILRQIFGSLPPAISTRMSSTMSLVKLVPTASCFLLISEQSLISSFRMLFLPFPDFNYTDLNSAFSYRSSPYEKIDDACRWFDSLKPGPQLSSEDIEKIARGTAIDVCKITCRSRHLARL